MAKPLPNDLNYGHAGQATYNLENGEWSFSRYPGHPGGLQQLGPWKTVFEPTSESGYARSPDPAPHNARHAQEAATLLGRNDPSLQPSLSLLAELTLTSAFISSTTQTYDPAIGNLLSFGSFTSEGLYSNARPIVAHPSGENGSVLRLGVLTKVKNGWQRDKSTWLQGYSMIDGESGYWVESAVPIQQICFSQGENRASFLAVRHPRRTRIFRPIYHDRRKPAMRSSYYELPSSRVDPRPILSIVPEQTGGVPHADITFNPDYQRQFGIVDQKGNWSVWDIDGGSRKVSNYAVSCTILGPLGTSEVESGNEDHSALEDGWARILWIGDVNTILVCNRREMQLFDIGGGQFTILRGPSLMAEHSVDWILDVRKHPLNSHQFFVLTSTHLFVVAVTCKKDVLGHSDMEPGATILLSWAHFRGLEDITLRLCVSALSSEESAILVFSRLNSLITTYRFHNDSTDALRPVYSLDPTILEWDGISEDPDNPRHVSDIHMDWLQFRQDRQLASTSLGISYLNHGVHFCRFSVMFSDLSIRQAIFCTYSSVPGTTRERYRAVEPPGWTNVAHSRGAAQLSEGFVGLIDDFVVPDGMNTILVPTLKSPGSQATPSMRSSNSQENHKDRRVALTMDCSDIYDILTRSDYQSVTSARIVTETEEILSVIDRLKGLLDGSLSDEPLRGTMFESLNKTVQVADIDEASAQMRNLFHQFDDRRASKLQPIASIQALHVGDGSNADLNIAALYDSILRHWIAPMPASIPGRTRQSKERLARRIAAEVVLASSCIHRSPGVTLEQKSLLAENELLPETSQDSGISVSSQRSMDLTGLPYISQPSSSQTELSAQTLPSHPNAIARLSQYLQITKPPSVMSPNIGRVLMHWQPHDSPRNYDWEATTRTINAELNIDEPSQKERQRSKRKAERLLKKQKRELELGKRKTESQPLFGRTIGAPRSSPAPVVGMPSSSQTQETHSHGQSHGLNVKETAGPYVVQSQVEPGRYGERPQVKKKKGKARVSGF